ncbi:hypoxanthine phosphoribosyltransferase [Clostridium sp. BJN0001]|uniref:hypoxanthine phosphoribosyltransferase n=1 Tax=Clostridium sp. BJN0001 TaxID=2930219 RepID=UPI001FD04ACB|nr:hypoxanthine phosphoribosyltransferase [Clostridium sp. BJN0001]
MENQKRNILISKEDIEEKISELGKRISTDYDGKKLYVLSLLRGSFIFTADLVRAIDINVKIGFMTTSSYENNSISSGKVKIVNDVKDSLEGYDVLIVDDIVDTGITMNFVKEHILKLNPQSVKTCSLLDKPSRREVTIQPDYCCFSIKDVFVAGYGLNYGDYYRNVPYIFNFEN